MRAEIKYLIPCECLSDFRDSLQPYVVPDSFGKSGSGYYTVRSIYYDTPHLEFYQKKSAGLLIRKKIRIRAYDELSVNSLIFMEIKRKYNIYIFKDRAAISPGELFNFLSNPFSEQNIGKSGFMQNNKDNAGKFLFHYHRHSLAPTALIVYDREAFFSGFNTTLRITLDLNLRCSLLPSPEELFFEEGLYSCMRNYFILEIKCFRGYPRWLNDILKKYPVRRMALSKYTIGIDSHPDMKLLFSPKRVMNHGIIVRRTMKGEFIK